MPIVSPNFLPFIQDFWFLFRIAFVVFAGVYFIFSLIVIRQVYMLTSTLITEADVSLRFISIFHALVALGVVILFIYQLG